jgi:DNA-3-methyladenine glycosylase II
MKQAVAHLKRSDPILRSIMERTGRFAIQYREPVFETLVRSIVYQQLHGSAALAIFTRLSEAAQPFTPERILALRPDRLRRLGLSRQKISSIRDLARHARDGKVDFTRLARLEDPAVIAELTQVKGIGEWTAQMFLIFALRRPDVLPTGDLGIRAAIKAAYALPDLPKPAAMEAIAAPWRPYRSVASWYLWRSLDNPGAM